MTKPLGYVNRERSHGFVLVSFRLEIDDWLSVLCRGGVLSNGFALLLRPIPEGVIGIKPRGDTREKQRTIHSLGWAFRTPICMGKGQLLSALKSSGCASIFMKSQV